MSRMLITARPPALMLTDSVNQARLEIRGHGEVNLKMMALYCSFRCLDRNRDRVRLRPGRCTARQV